MDSTMTVKGQVTIPKAMREFLDIAPGDKVEFAYLEDGGIRVSPAKPAPRAGRQARGRFAALRGRIKLDARTDDLMRLLRGYDEDGKDPGFK
jgi:antitoxin PrlF